MTKVGLIQGRHPLPVSEYLLTDSTVPFNAAHHMAYTAAQSYCRTHGLGRHSAGGVELYATGLTRALLGAIAGFHDSGVVVSIVEYNAETCAYESVVAIGPGGFSLGTVYPPGSFSVEDQPTDA